jgi:DNA-directed RNA polymerase subunit N (RpoN/RPB10)
MDYYFEYPMRCKSCSRPLAHLVEQYELIANTESRVEALDALGLTRYCCRAAIMGPSRIYFNQEDRNVIEGEKNASAQPLLELVLPDLPPVRPRSPPPAIKRVGKHSRSTQPILAALTRPSVAPRTVAKPVLAPTVIPITTPVVLVDLPPELFQPPPANLSSINRPSPGLGVVPVTQALTKTLSVEVLTGRTYLCR